MNPFPPLYLLVFAPLLFHWSPFFTYFSISFFFLQLKFNFKKQAAEEDQRRVCQGHVKASHLFRLYTTFQEIMNLSKTKRRDPLSAPSSPSPPSPTPSPSPSSRSLNPSFVSLVRQKLSGKLVELPLPLNLTLPSSLSPAELDWLSFGFFSLLVTSLLYLIFLFQRSKLLKTHKPLI